MSFARAVMPLAYVAVSFAAVGVVYYTLAGLNALVRVVGGARKR